ncbi:glycoside hydrolase family 3 N-terminal domain-containing protein [Marinilabilia sp.]|uniref:glycoside hydrolase family 3 N-terminal domain-containing protein n=1 Tax=Marinilabilia sp. TaxID=2021252 RepID=UPI0025C5127C|nr:glycoside hydrolase family 3 N-terminal domain-containing protein [Marinilabilia sp.]
MKKTEEIVDSMTLEQKARLVIGTGMVFELPDGVEAPFEDPLKAYSDTTYAQMVKKIREVLPGAAGFTAEFPEMGITSQVLADGPAGLRISPKRKGTDDTFYCTAFPIATLLASSWDTELVEEVGSAMGKEVLEYGGDILLAPALNIQRDPLCGRNFEYYSEDPLISGKMAAAIVNGVQSNGVGTSIKHFAANNQETNRLSVNTIISERALREIYLRGFEIAVRESQPWTVMSAYNKINEEYASESHDLLTKILRDDWGFEGYVVTDWGAGDDLAAQMKAGNDLIMPGQPNQIEKIIQEVKEGRLDEEVLDENIKRILSVMMKTPKYRGYNYSLNPDLKAHAQIARQVAAEGMVLLENRNEALPVSSDLTKKVAAFGNSSYEFISGGTGSGDVNEAYTISLIEGLENGNFQANDELEKRYNAHIEAMRAKAGAPRNWLTALMGGRETVDELEVSPEMASDMAEKTDIALITIGRNSGEAGDREAVAGDFYLTETEKKLIKNVSEAYQSKEKKAIVILNIGGPVETASWKHIPDAVLLAWQPGQEAGNAVVDILSGKVNPSGKLAVSFPVAYEDSPSSSTFPGQPIEGTTEEAPDLSGFSMMKRTPWEVSYEDDIFVGYRYYKTFEKTVSYEFGYGLSYTGFSYNNLKISSREFTDKLTLSVEIANTGAIAGREIVQVYLTAPEGKLVKPSLALINFGKTNLLQPGESEKLTFEISARDLTFFDAEAGAWTAEAGDYAVSVGSSSNQIKQNENFSLQNTILVEKVSKHALSPTREITKLTPAR